jgi:5,10-methenyltetrahydromethanopterin hydrogenase
MPNRKIQVLRRCSDCGEFFSEKTLMYQVFITLRAEVTESLNLDEVESADPETEMEELLEQMEEMDPEELADQVHESYEFLICPKCRQKMHRALKMKAKLESGDFIEE